MGSPEQGRGFEINKKEQELSPEILQAWEEYKKVGLPWALKKGKETGIPQQMLDSYTQEYLEQETDLPVLYRVRKNLKLGSAEDIRNAGINAYDYFISREDFEGAMQVAKEIYGEESDEYQKSREMYEQRETDIESEPVFELPIDATFADLQKAIGPYDEDGYYLFDYLERYFDKDAMSDAQTLLMSPMEEAGKVKILDFFTSKNYSRGEVEANLPIKFTEKK